MKITLMKKTDPTHKDALIIQYVQLEGKTSTKVTTKLDIGESIDLPDDIAYDVMNRYRGLFALEGSDAARISAGTKQYAHKAKPGYATKVTESEA